MGLGRSRSSFAECDQVAKWASATTPAALYLTPASMACEARRDKRDYQSTQVDLDGTRRGLDQLPWRRPTSRRMFDVESTTRPGRRESSAQRSALAAPYQVRTRGHISGRVCIAILTPWPSPAAVSSLDRNAIAGQCGTSLGVKIPQITSQNRRRHRLGRLAWPPEDSRDTVSARVHG